MGGRLTVLTVIAVAVDGARFTIRQLRLSNVISDSRVEFRCSGKRCPGRRVRVVHPRGARVNLMPAIGKSRDRFRAGQTLEVRITAPERIGKVVRYELRRGRTPDGRPLCLRPGETRAKKCP
jgi:hypothetical protein